MFPGLATARVLQARGHDVTLWLAGKSIEASTRHAWTGPVVSIASGGLSCAPIRLPFTIVTLVRVYHASLRALRQHRPQVMLAMGSYSSMGPVLAARRLRIPVVLHEANVIPGRAIDWLSRWAHTVAVNFPETADYLPGKTMVVTGIPLRKELEVSAGMPRLTPARFTILIMGGSQGARRVNELAVEALCRMHREGIPLNVVHLSGEKDQSTVTAAYRTAGVPHTVHGFLKDMATAYQGADLAVARSGANSCMELALFGVPALLVPYPLAARNHQLANARAMAASGAADVIEQKDLTVDGLADYLKRRMKEAPALEAMHLASRRRAVIGADEKLADLVEQVAAGR